MKKMTIWVTSILMIASAGFVTGCQKSTQTADTGTTAHHIPNTLGKGLEKAVKEEKAASSKSSQETKQNSTQQKSTQ